MTAQPSVGDVAGVVVGRRERKKLQTRRRLEEAALDLFEERGYEATTVEDITEAADVAVRTFFRYFSSKEALLVGPTDEALAALSSVLGAQEPSGSPFDDVVQGLKSLRTQELTQAQPDVLRRLRLVEQVPAARAGVLEAYARWEGVLADHLGGRAADLGGGPGDLQPRLVAAAVMAAFRVAVATWVASDGRQSVDEVFDEAVARLGTGLSSHPTPHDTP